MEGSGDFEQGDLLGDHDLLFIQRRLYIDIGDCISDVSPVDPS